jgi:predicted  nucleic acid-binding Zn-ribbon protein
MEADFLDAYNAGYHLYTLRRNVNRAASAIVSKENELDRIEEQLVRNGAAIIADGASMEDRALLLVEMKNLAERTGQLQSEIKDLHEVRARNQVELEHYQHVVADLGY